MKRLLLILLTLILTLPLTACFGGGDEGEISVFYYSYSDTYVTGVRGELDRMLSEAGKRFTDYDGAGNQTTQTEQVQTAIAKGSRLLIVNVVDTGSDDAAQNIIRLASEKSIPVIFFNRSVEERVITGYDKCAYVGTDYEMAGRLQGEMVGSYVLEHFAELDRNADGEISYAMFKGQEGNLEANARTRFAVEEANALLANGGKPALRYFNPDSSGGYLVDPDGLWSSAAANNHMSTVLTRHSDSAGNMIELVIANNDEMALGALSALQAAGYNTGEAGKTIPVFGIDATAAARSAIAAGTMTGSVKQDAEGMANAILTLAENLEAGREVLSGIPEENKVGTWRVNIPYSPYESDEQA